MIHHKKFLPYLRIKNWQYIARGGLKYLTPMLLSLSWPLLAKTGSGEEKKGHRYRLRAPHYLLKRHPLIKALDSQSYCLFTAAVHSVKIKENSQDYYRNRYAHTFRRITRRMQRQNYLSIITLDEKKRDFTFRIKTQKGNIKKIIIARNGPETFSLIRIKSKLSVSEAIQQVLLHGAIENELIKEGLNMLL